MSNHQVEKSKDLEETRLELDLEGEVVFLSNR